MAGSMPVQARIVEIARRLGSGRPVAGGVPRPALCVREDDVWPHPTSFGASSDREQ